MKVLTKEEYAGSLSSETIKQGYLASSQTELSTERFIFACYESVKIHEKIEGLFKKDFEWPCVAKKESSFASTLTQMLEWHFSNHLADLANKVLSISNLTYVSIHMAHLEKDFRRLCLESGMIDTRDGRPLQVALNDLLMAIDKVFSKYIKDLSKSFFTWLYSKPKLSVVDFNQVPPVGRYARMVINARNRSPSSHPETQEKSSEIEVAVPSDAVEGRRPSREASPRKEAVGTPDRNARPKQARVDRGPRERKPDQEKDMEQEAATLALVDVAIQSLSSNLDLKEVVLAPQNSYYRRLQHQKAVDAGFISDSVGEGKERAVKISRA
ncbi:MAG: R3H domain-containing nucleic acid-binding protein [Pseudomonadota bacterium]